MTNNEAQKFLVVVDDTPECRKALRFACRRAQRTGGQVALLRVLRPADFQHWLAVEKRMEEEATEEAEELLRSLANQARENWGLEVEVKVSQGETYDVVLKLIEEDSAIRILVLGAAPGGEGPGPLVSQLAGKISGGMRVPITVVPGNLSDQQIDELT